LSQGGRPREGNRRGIPVAKKTKTPQAEKLQQKTIFISNATAGDRNMPPVYIAKSPRKAAVK